MRYFEYISDAKVDMLLPQISGNKKTKVSGELSMNLKALTAKISAERETQPLEDRIHRLEVVEKYIRAHEPVGVITHPEKWIEGEGYALTSLIQENKDVVFYFMRSGGSYLGLGGSADHLVGRKPDKSSRFGYSYSRDLLHALWTLEKGQFFSHTDEGQTRFVNSSVAGQPHPWGDIIWHMCHHRQDRSFKSLIRFLAKRLDVTTFKGCTTILATPLFIETIDI